MEDSLSRQYSSPTRHSDSPISNAGSSHAHSRSKGSHEAPFVQPSSYLRPQGYSRPTTPTQRERVFDDDERQALVSSYAPLSVSCYVCFMFFTLCLSLVRPLHHLSCLYPTQLPAVAWTVLMSSNNPSFQFSPNALYWVIYIYTIWPRTRKRVMRRQYHVQLIYTPANPEIRRYKTPILIPCLKVITRI